MTPDLTPPAIPHSNDTKAAASDAVPAGRQIEWSDVERVGRIVAYAALGAYVVGLLIVNMYLYQIGMTDFSVLRTRFILTGVLATLPVMVVILIVLEVATTIVGIKTKHRAERARGKRISGSDLVFHGLVPILALIGTVVLLVTAGGIDFRWSLAPVVLFYLALLFLALDSTSKNSLILSGWARGSDGWQPSRVQKIEVHATTIVLGGILAFIYLDTFASTFYPKTPEQFGGGKPKQVQIVLSPESAALGVALGFGAATDSPIVRRVDLLWESDKVYVVRDLAKPDGQIIQIDRDAVSAVVLGPELVITAHEVTPLASPVTAP